MQTLWYLTQLFLSLAFGAIVAHGIGKSRLHRGTALSLDVILYSLLFLMGVNTASIDDIENQIMRMGFDALVSTVLVTLGCIVSASVLGMLLSRRVSSSQHARQQITWRRLKTPLLMIAIVVAGIVLSSLTDLFVWYDSSMITIVLYILLFLVGMQMVQHEVDLLSLVKSPLMLLLPVSTIVGTYLGALAIPLLTSYSLREALTLVSGFGWYSLSGVLISGLGDPQLGAVSFLSNLFRESLAFILIPLLATLSRTSFSAVSIAGATSMDVTLPLLKKSLGETVVPLAIAHGVAMTLVAPFLIPLWYG
ncbi:lysine exporter LysO family protein [Pleomorphochaeta sp. DL1XJH-081]|uniref:lysine exporter LysO family protein n=1 Tax=Pleomorphochaeta sp. DL1XJH-081 TaxID=3409690 RepID=UPI003BB5A2BC